MVEAMAAANATLRLKKAEKSLSVSIKVHLTPKNVSLFNKSSYYPNECKNLKNFSIPEPIFSCDLYEINIISLNFTSNFSISCEGDAYDLHCCWLQQPKRRRSGYITAHDSIYCIMIYLVDGIIHCSHYQVTIEYTSLGVCSKLVTGMLSVCS